VWLTAAQALAVFNIRKAVDESGREIEPLFEPTTGIISRLAPYKASIKPRSAEHEALICQAETLYPWEQSDAAELSEIKV
jgi:fumagillin biosynthesis cytochrome P450 monooxygenase